MFIALLLIGVHSRLGGGTQWGMFLALLGVVMALLVLRETHGHSPSALCGLTERARLR